MNLIEICDKFNLDGEFSSAKKLNVGNINNTYKVYYKNNNILTPYIIQKINKNVFKRPDLVMRNIISISNHLFNKLNDLSINTERNVLTYMLTKNNIAYYKDEDNEYWRCYRFIDKSETFNTTNDLNIIEQAGYAFGQFQLLLCDFDASKLHESIPNFHNTEYRFKDFEKSIRLNLANRVEIAKEEIDYLLSKKELASSLCKMLKNNEIPLKVTHNDTKCNNVLFDISSHKALAVIDLDTVMPGLVAYDFGDAIRSIAATCDEDEKDLSKIDINIEKLEAFTKGFVSKVGKSLTDKEFESLSIGILVITLELASRFLKDYLDGDTYFKINYENHNLIRARCQIQLAKKFEENIDKINEIINKYK